MCTYICIRNLNEEAFTDRNTEVQTEVWMEKANLNLNFGIRVKPCSVVYNLINK
jgi:hypothetical protein